MSGRHICICGKKRGQKPITITVTQCPKKHEIKTTGLDFLEECDNYPTKQEPSSQEKRDTKPAELKQTKDSMDINKSAAEGLAEKEIKDNQEGSTEESKEKITQNLREDSVSKADDLEQNETFDTSVKPHSEEQTEKEPSDKTENIIENEDKGAEIVQKSEDEPKETPQEDIPEPTDPETSQQQIVEEVEVHDHRDGPEAESTEQTSHQVDTPPDASAENEEKETDEAVEEEPETTNEAPEIVEDEEPNAESDVTKESAAINQSPSKTDSKDIDDQTIMYMMDASLNTTPFLDNLFMAIPRTSRKSSSDHYQCKQCMLEIFVFGRHTKNCKYSFSEQNLFNCLSDGNTILEAVGKLAFPVRRNGIEDDSYSVYSELNSNILKGKTITKNELTNIYASTFRKLEALIKRDRLVEMMKHRNQTENTKHKQIDFTQNGTDKAIQLDRNSSVHALNDFCVQFTSMSAPSISRSIQFNQNSKTESKWYDTFLMCFGIKANEDCKIDEETLATRLHGISSIEISKYLKI